MLNHQMQLKREIPRCLPIRPPLGLMMDSREAIRQLRRAGLLTKKDTKRFRRWLRDGCPPVKVGTRLDWINWATWMWEMTPASFVDH